MEGYIRFLYGITYRLNPLISLAILVIAVIIIAVKEKGSKILGAVSAAGIIGAIPQMVILYASNTSGDVDMDFMRRWTIISSAAGYVFTPLAVALILYYFKYRYDVNTGALVILFAARIISAFAVALIIRLMYSSLNTNRMYEMSYLSHIISLLINNILFNSIFLWIFLKNRAKENELKFIWLSRLIPLVFAVINCITYAAGLIMFAEYTGNIPAEWNIPDMIGSAFVIILFMDMLAAPVIPVYILAKAKKAEK